MTDLEKRTDEELLAAESCNIGDTKPYVLIREWRERCLTAEPNARRYEWLRDPKTDVALVLDKQVGESTPGLCGEASGFNYEYRAGEELDAAIDSAMSERGA